MNKIKIKNIIQSSIDVKQKLLKDDDLINVILKISDEIINAFKNNNKLLLCGNGGSAADAQHIAAEFSGRFYYDRDPLFAEALHTNTSFITAVANDFSFDQVYSRAVKAKGKKNDILIAISTSGNSENIVNAVIAANKIGMITVGMTGKTGGKIKDICKYLINIPSDDTPRIQEVHILIGHILCEIVESKMFPK
jgi:D-sedoheptulose 7-phosphate isomerase